MITIERTICLALLLFSLCGCQHVQPWERGDLARKEMQLNPDNLSSQLYRQVYESKEASSGGGVTAGAGCGCN